MKRIVLTLCLLMLTAAPAMAQFGGAPSQSVRGSSNVFGGTNYSNGVSTRPNVFGGQDFYKNGSRIGSSRSNVFGGQTYSNGVRSQPNVFGGMNYSNGTSSRPNVFGGQDYYRGGTRLGSSQRTATGSSYRSAGK